MFENTSFGKSSRNRGSPSPSPGGPAARYAVIKKPLSSPKRVAFSSNDQVRVFEPDLLHDDEAFIYTAKEFLRLIKADVRKKKGSRGWFTSSISNNTSTTGSSSSSESDSSTEMENMDKFREAFEHRLKDLPEMKNARIGKVDDLIRELVLVIHLAPNGSKGTYNDENESSMHGHGYGHGHGRGGPKTFLRKSNVMMNEIESLQQRIRFKLTAHRSVETVLGEMRHLSEVSRSTMVREVKDFCMREIKVMEYILEDMGYHLSTQAMGM